MNRLLICVLALVLIEPSTSHVARAAQAPASAGATSPAVSKAMDEMVAELLGGAAGSKGVRRPGPVRFEGSAWQSGSGAVGTSALGLQMDRAVTDALAARHVETLTGSSVGSKGVGGSILRGGFKLLKGGMNVSLSLVDANTGRVISEARRMLSTSSLTGLAIDHLLPPDAGNARALAQLVTQSLGGSASAFHVQVSTDRGPQGAYFENDPLQVSVQSDRDCYLRLYHVSWGDKTLTLIFPNEGDRDSFVPAGTLKQVPSAGSTAQFVVSKPYGVDAIIAIASSQPFADDAFVSSQLAGNAGSGSDAALGSRGVVRAGSYLATDKATEARARAILAKGLIVRQGGAPQSSGAAAQGGTHMDGGNGNSSTPLYQDGTASGGTSGTPGGSSTTPLVNPAAPATQGQVAKASCYYTTLPRLTLGR